MSKSQNDLTGKASGQEEVSEMRVFFVPYTAENPYQEQLAAGLSKHAIRVVPGRGERHLINLIRGEKRGQELTHLHWLLSWKKDWRKSVAVIKSIGTLILQRLFRHPVVWTIHNLQHHEAEFPRADRFLGKLVYHLASRVVIHSPLGKEAVQNAFGISDAEKMSVIPHGNYCECYPNDITRHDARKKLDLDEDTVVFLFLGNIRGYKGINDLLEAFARLEHDKVRLVIAGKVIQDEELDQTHITDRVLFHPGYVPDEEIQVYMNAADLVVFPYRDVLTSGAVVLGMSFGRACLAPRIGCICDYLDDEGAVLYDPNEEDGLLKAMNEAVARRDELEVMGQKNYACATEWSWDRVAGETAEVYHAAIKG